MNIGNIGKMMKDLHGMQAKMKEQIDSIEEEATAGGGMVTARINGKKELLSLRIDPQAIHADEAELLQDLIVAAINEAGRKVDDQLKGMTAGLAGGLDLPGMG